MKKLFLIAAMMVASMGAFAQFTIKPMVGMTVSKVTADDAKYKVGLAAGVEGEYKFNPNMGVSAGLIYSMQGSKIEHNVSLLFSQYNAECTSNFSMDWINVPILFNYYFGNSGFSVRAGIQPGFRVRAKWEIEDTGLGSTIEDHITSYADEHWDIKDYTKSFSMAIPIGVAYEISDFVIDARYNIGLTNINDSKLSRFDGKYSVFMLTVGYKIPL